MIKKISVSIVLVLALLAACIGWFLIDTDPRAKVRDWSTFTKGSYVAFAAPWAAQTGLMHRWSNHADVVLVDLPKFPNNTGVEFTWPPFTPRGGIAGVWGYMGLAHGNYDGGTVEVPVPARRVDDIKALSQTFSWTPAFRLGVADVLTEFYLRSDPEDSDSKLVEIGWFLHLPERSRSYLAKAKVIGRYVDPQGTPWNVVRNDNFITFSAPDYRDVLKGRIDMLAALHWLKDRKLVTGREWYTGVAIGVEPFKGTGKMQIDHWAVDYR